MTISVDLAQIEKSEGSCKEAIIAVLEQNL